jgi:tRNA pseudouridine13 synthase
MVRKKLKTDGNLEWAYENFPKSLNYERTMIKSLIQKSDDYKRCAKRLPKTLLRLLISSFQSYLFNRMISMRSEKRYSLFEPLDGDIICILDDDNGRPTQIKYRFGGKYDEYLMEALSLNRASIVVPLIGFDTDLNDFPLFQEIFEELVNQENIDPSIFNSNYLKDFDFRGTYRKMTIKPIGIKIVEINEDEFFPNKMKMKLQFSLPSGTYATMLLRELMK